MCWSGEASSVIGLIGVISTIYCIKQGESRECWIPLLYFTAMEVLQAFNYIWLNQCDSPYNQMFAMLGYLHIAFQPFFINMVAMHFIPESVKEKIKVLVYSLCCIGALMFLYKLYPFAWAGKCTIGKESLCGEYICALRGEWHIAWQLPLNGLGQNNFGELYWTGPEFANGLHAISYLIFAFILPFLYGSWKATTTSYFMGPFLAGFFTKDINEIPAIWCLFSIFLCLTIIKSPLKKHLYVKKWPFYPKEQ